MSLNHSRMKSNLRYACLLIFPSIFCCILYINYNSIDEKLYIPNRNEYVVESTTLSTYLKEIIDNVIFEQKKLLKTEMTNGTFKTKLKKRSRPRQVIILTTWRSGSTFLGQIINSQIGNYYHFEPLAYFGLKKQIRDPSIADEAFKVVNNLLHCNYDDLEEFLKFQKGDDWYKFKANPRLWQQCVKNPDICYRPEFLNSFCKIHPFQLMKLTRLRLQTIEDVFHDQTLNVRVILLVRDPRGTVHSRRHENWCNGESDCERIDRLCSDLVLDYATAKRLKYKYHSRFTVIRYEDLATDPYQTVQKLFAFFDLEMSDSVTSYLDTHTKIDKDDPTVPAAGNTFKNSAVTPFQWINDWDLSQVLEVEDQCDLAMDLWGYLKVGQERNESLMVPFRL